MYKQYFNKFISVYLILFDNIILLISVTEYNSVSYLIVLELLVCNLQKSEFFIQYLVHLLKISDLVRAQHCVVIYIYFIKILKNNFYIKIWLIKKYNNNLYYILHISYEKIYFNIRFR